MEQQDLFAALEARESALATVSHNSGDWLPLALDAIKALPPDWEGTGESLRLRLLKDGLPAPHHHNAWGALTAHAIRRELIFKTGRWSSMRTPKSHARATPVLRRSRGDLA